MSVDVSTGSIGVSRRTLHDNSSGPVSEQVGSGYIEFGSEEVMGIRRRRRAWAVLAACVLSVMAAAGWVGYRTWPRKLPDRALRPAYPEFETANGRSAVNAPGAALVTTVETFKDELLAYLHFEYFRCQPEIDGDRVLLTAVEAEGGPMYRIQLVLDRNLLATVPYVVKLAARREISKLGFGSVTETELASRRKETKLFISAYNFPVRRKLEELPAARVLSPLSRFILFKSKTDRRIRERIEPRPAVLSSEEATRLAADITAVARFYKLPLDFFLGIGAMENNYMTIIGDTQHTVWKRRAQPGDIVVKRRRGRVLVSNFSIGLWQITRETLRRAHDLYLRDSRDYSSLPERLRPPNTLDVDNVEPGPLTTYAGLLVRHLLDRFDGNVEKAVGAYNGGPGNPNLKYAVGVAAVAQYARHIVEHAAVLNGQKVAQTQFITARHRGHRAFIVQR